MTPDAETEALLKILALGDRQVAEGKVHDAKWAIENLRQKLRGRSEPAATKGTEE